MDSDVLDGDYFKGQASRCTVNNGLTGRAVYYLAHGENRSGGKVDYGGKRIGDRNGND
ncbi:MAG: hypothetical protein PVSMB7_03070 [Chloroflexota bacterium]